MVLDYEYGINTGNRFINFVDHDEDPDDFIAEQTKAEDKSKKSTKETKPVTSASSKKTTKTTTTTTTTPASASTTNATSNATRTNKENLTGRSTNTDQRRQQSNVLGDNNNQQTRTEGGRGGGGNRGFSRRGGSAGQDRPAYEGGRGGGQQRTHRFTKFEGQQATSGFEQGGDAWGAETTNDNNNQSFGNYRGRGRGGPRRGNYEGGRGGYEGGRGGYEGGRGGYEGGRGGYEGGRGGYEGGRGGYEGGRGGGRGRGRGRGGRGGFNNQSFEEGSQQQQQQTQEGGGWDQNPESNTDNTRSQSARTGDQELDTDVPAQDQPFEQDNVRRGGRGHFRSRTFRNNRNYGGDRQHHYENETGEVSQNEYRHNRHQHDRQSRTNTSGIKPIEKKDGEGSHNWGDKTENPEEHPVPDDVPETTGQAASSSWAEQVDEAEKQMTLDEYKKQIEAKKQAQHEKLPQFNRRTAGEGEDQSKWQNFHVYRKTADDDELNEEEADEESGAEENESGEEEGEEQVVGKKRIISIPLHFKPIEMPRGPAGSRGGPRRGGAGGGRYRDRPFRDDRPYRDDQTRSKSPSQQQTPSSQQTGEYQNDEQQQQQQSRPYRGGGGGFRPGSGRTEYRRSYGNSARGSRGSYNRSNVDPNKIDLDNKVDFPTLAKP